MIEMTITKALLALGFESGWAANEHGIILWDNEAKQPTEAELIAAGWVKPDAE
jgi:co-chaperonin GroES (HSP10)